MHFLVISFWRASVFVVVISLSTMFCRTAASSVSSFLYFFSSSESSIMIMVGFMPELLAWDSLRQLMLLLDKAVEVRFCST